MLTHENKIDFIDAAVKRLKESKTEEFEGTFNEEVLEEKIIALECLIEIDNQIKNEGIENDQGLEEIISEVSLRIFGNKNFIQKDQLDASLHSCYSNKARLDLAGFINISDFLQNVVKIRGVLQACCKELKAETYKINVNKNDFLDAIANLQEEDIAENIDLLMELAKALKINIDKAEIGMKALTVASGKSPQAVRKTSFPTKVRPAALFGVGNPDKMQEKICDYILRGVGSENSKDENSIFINQEVNNLNTALALSFCADNIYEMEDLQEKEDAFKRLGTTFSFAKAINKPLSELQIDSLFAKVDNIKAVRESLNALGVILSNKYVNRNSEQEGSFARIDLARKNPKNAIIRILESGKQEDLTSVIAAVVPFVKLSPEEVAIIFDESEEAATVRYEINRNPLIAAINQVCKDRPLEHNFDTISQKDGLELRRHIGGFLEAGLTNPLRPLFLEAIYIDVGHFNEQQFQELLGYLSELTKDFDVEAAIKNVRTQSLLVKIGNKYAKSNYTIQSIPGLNTERKPSFLSKLRHKIHKEDLSSMDPDTTIEIDHETLNAVDLEGFSNKEILTTHLELHSKNKLDNGSEVFEVNKEAVIIDKNDKPYILKLDGKLELLSRDELIEKANNDIRNKKVIKMANDVLQRNI